MALAVTPQWIKRRAVLEHILETVKADMKTITERESKERIVPRHVVKMVMKNQIKRKPKEIA